VFLKDWRVFPRDMRNVQQLIFPLALAVVWIFRLLTLPPQPDGVAANVQSASMNGALVINWLVDLSSIGITFFLCFTLSNAIAGPGISREGRTYWLLKLAPMSELRVLFGKLVLAYLPYPLIGTPVLVLLTVLSPTSPLTFVNHWVVLMLLGLGSTCLSLGLGAAFPRMDWDNPQQQASIVAGCLWLLLSPLYISLVLIAVFGIPALSMLPMVDQSLQAVLGMLGWLVALLLTAGVVWASLYVGEQSLQRLEP
jgi:ABC-2 type transport system permease protein